MNDLKLGKLISYALRHNPQQFNLVPDKEGYVLISDLIAGLLAEENIQIELADIERIMANSDKKRYEIAGDKIRATYGHSKVQIEKEAIMPPAVLYHGTTHKAYKSIAQEGLKPMQRQFVHLSEEIKTAEIVAKRRESNFVLLEIDAKKAYEDGIKFHHGNDTTWLSEEIGIKYIKVLKI